MAFEVSRPPNATKRSTKICPGSSKRASCRCAGCPWHRAVWASVHDNLETADEGEGDLGTLECFDGRARLQLGG
jgi:hypothetical protein